MSDQYLSRGKITGYDMLQTRNDSSIFNESLGRSASRSAQARNSFFYASGFKQLHSLQQKQVGLIVGAAVADAALKPLVNLSTPAALRHMVAEAVEDAALEAATPPFEDSSMRPNNRLIKSDVVPVSDESILDGCIFATAGSIHRANRLHPLLADTKPVAAASASQSMPLEEEIEPATEKRVRRPPSTPAYLSTLSAGHSYPYSLMFQYIQQYTSDRHAPDLSQVAALWRQAAQAQAREYTPFHGELPILTACCAMLASPPTYAWADKQRLCAYSDAFVDCLLEELKPLSSRSVSSEPAVSSEDVMCIAKESIQTILLLALKSLQHNPNPITNTLHCVSNPDVRQLIFPSVALEAVGDVRNEAALLRLNRSPLHLDGVVLRTATQIIQRAPTFKDGILMCTRQAAQLDAFPLRALPALGMVVGACLGAKFGVQQVPTEWIMATPDNSVVCASAMDLANWSWNNPSRLKQGTI